MRKPYNIPLRVRAYNKHFKTKESEIFLKVEAKDPYEATNYTSLLYERYLQEGAKLEIKGGMHYLYWKLIHPGGLYLKALNFLQVLAYLDYYETLRQNKRNAAIAVLNAYNERERSKQQTAEKAKEEESKGFSYEEKNGVTFIKGTNFVISKIL
ncbi:hypothetical protein [Rufibacter latericius]|uniref:Uncharacterized protein n=1 Tax=Rufibacter latericius TaxID=2487040 RepID=A0A3M9MBT2_9BACT|nr:hypothetical protein [Rufibacter latericius]RNI22607.1 hypothetical protein EFB08_21160 [Rufibacter latericius]